MSIEGLYFILIEKKRSDCGNPLSRCHCEARSADRGQKVRHIERKRNIPPNNRRGNKIVVSDLIAPLKADNENLYKKYKKNDETKKRKS